MLWICGYLFVLAILDVSPHGVCEYVSYERSDCDAFDYVHWLIKRDLMRQIAEDIQALSNSAIKRFHFLLSFSSYCLTSPFTLTS